MSVPIRRVSWVILALLLAAATAGAQERSNPVGMRQIEFTAGDRHLAHCV